MPPEWYQLCTQYKYKENLIHDGKQYNLLTFVLCHRNNISYTHNTLVWSTKIIWFRTGRSIFWGHFCCATWMILAIHTKPQLEVQREFDTWLDTVYFLHLCCATWTISAIQVQREFDTGLDTVYFWHLYCATWIILAIHNTLAWSNLCYKWLTSDLFEVKAWTNWIWQVRHTSDTISFINDRFY